MADLSTNYMNLPLKNPVIAGSCGLTKSLVNIKKLEEVGVGAVVLKSLFEEQIIADNEGIDTSGLSTWHPESYDYLENMSMELGPREYLKLIKEAKSEVSIPVIASLNCMSSRWWTDYAGQIEKAGADGLELNIAIMPVNPNKTEEEIHNIYFDIIKRVKEQTQLPLAVKIGPYFTSIIKFVQGIERTGVDAVVLFNRFYQIDMDIDKLEITSGLNLSAPQEMFNTLRWVSLLSGKVNCDIAASTGIYDETAVVKQILAGADAVQMVSAIYKHGMDKVTQILNNVKMWMDKHNFDSLEQFKGKMKEKESESPEKYYRLQYIKAAVGVE